MRRPRTRSCTRHRTFRRCRRWKGSCCWSSEMDTALQRTTRNSPAEDEPQQKLPGTMVLKTTSTRKNFDRTKRKRYATQIENQANQSQGRTKRNSMLLEHHANSNTMWAYGLRMHQCDIPLDRNLPLMLMNNGKCYKRKHGRATTLQTANTSPTNAKNTRDHSSQS